MRRTMRKIEMYPDLPPKGVYPFFIYNAADGVSKSDYYYINLFLRSEAWRDGQEDLVTVVCMTQGNGAQIGSRILRELNLMEDFEEDGEEYVRFLEPNEMVGIEGAVKVSHRFDSFKSADITCNEIGEPYFGQCGIMSEKTYKEYLSQPDVKSEHTRELKREDKEHPDKSLYENLGHDDDDHSDSNEDDDIPF